MLEYIFFNPKPLQLFVAFLDTKRIPYHRLDKDEGLVVAVSEDIEDRLLDEMDDEYDQLMDLDQQLAEAQEAEVHQGVSLSFRLHDGRTSNAVVDPAIVSRILEVVSVQELNQLIEAIVAAVENPDQRSICQRLADKKANLAKP